MVSKLPYIVLCGIKIVQKNQFVIYCLILSYLVIAEMDRIGQRRTFFKKNVNVDILNLLTLLAFDDRPRKHKNGSNFNFRQN